MFHIFIICTINFKYHLFISGGLKPVDRPVGEIVLEDIHYSYNNTPLIRGVNLHLWPGKSIALVGRSGCGKSTIASLIMRLYDPEKGRILLDGIDIRNLDPVWLRSHIGYVSQVSSVILKWPLQCFSLCPNRNLFGVSADCFQLYYSSRHHFMMLV